MEKDEVPMQKHTLGFRESEGDGNVEVHSFRSFY